MLWGTNFHKSDIFTFVFWCFHKTKRWAFGGPVISFSSCKISHKQDSLPLYNIKRQYRPRPPVLDLLIMLDPTKLGGRGVKGARSRSSFLLVLPLILPCSFLGRGRKGMVTLSGWGEEGYGYPVRVWGGRVIMSQVEEVCHLVDEPTLPPSPLWTESHTSLNITYVGGQ